MKHTRCAAGASADDAAYGIVSSEGFVQRSLVEWYPPVRLMANAHMPYRHSEGRSGPPREREPQFIPREQLVQAYTLPDADIRAMRKR